MILKCLGSLKVVMNCFAKHVTYPGRSEKVCILDESCA